MLPITKKLTFLCVFASLAVVTTADAQTKKRANRPVYKSVDSSARSNDPFKGPSPRNEHEVGFGLGLNYFNSFGFQGRYAYRAMPEGFIEEVNEAFLVEGGAGMTLYGKVKDKTGVTGVHFFAAGRWDFIMDPTWTFFGTLGLGYNATSIDTSDVKGGGLFPVVGVGAFYTLNDDWALRGDFSYHFLGVGAAYRF